MNIHIQTLLAKMGEELAEARTSSKNAELREKIYSIKSLCEVILAEDKPEAPAQVARPVPPQAAPVVPSAFGQGQKLKMDDDANGDSLFDF